MVSNLAQHYLSEGLVNGQHMNVMNSAEIKHFLECTECFRSNSYAVIAVQKGSVVFQNNFASVTLKPKDVYLVTPGTLFEFDNMSDDAQFISMGFKKEYLKEQGVYLNGAEIIHLLSSDLLNKFSLNEEEFADMVASLNSLKRKMKLSSDTPHLKDIIRHGFLAVLYEILIFYSKYRVFTSVKLNRQEELTTNFLNLLSEQFKLEKRVQYYADALFVTSRYLSTVVKKVTGKTAGEIIDEMVINEAKVLLSSHLMNVAQVADELRFSDQSFFGKFFKKYTGISPSIYKANNTVVLNAPF
ncbi:helix-turn-helix domain-containing protein [Pedobacter sp.]